MTPIEVTAHLHGQVCLQNGPIALDGLLAAAVALRDQLPPPLSVHDIVPIEIPIQREPAGQFHLASVSHYQVEAEDLRHVNLRPPIYEAQALGEARLKRMDISAGRSKGWRIPLATMHVVEDQLRWWCIGDHQGIVDLLALVPHIGKKRAVGLGAVERWDVRPCEPWDGFPVLRDGLPLRPLPLTWRGLSEAADRGMANRTYPYWLRAREQPSAVP